MLDFSYVTTEAQPSSVGPRLTVSFDIRYSVSDPQNRPLHLWNVIGESGQISSKGRSHIGVLSPQKALYGFTSNGQHQSFPLFLDLNMHQLNVIEELREGGDLRLAVTIKGITDVVGTTPSVRKEMSADLTFAIAKSDWVEKLLTSLKFKEVALIEVPRLDNSPLVESVQYINSAWKNFAMGSYNATLTNCRRALESLGTAIREKDFEKKIIENGKERTVPDWEKLLGNKRRGDAFREIFRKQRSFTGPSAHAGSSVNREEAYFSILSTTGIVTLISRKLEVIPQ